VQIEDSELFKLLLGAVGSMGAMVFAGVKTVLSRIRKLEINTVSKPEFEMLEREVVRKEDFREYVERSEKSRGELRDAVVKLFDRFDDLKTIIIEQGKRE
jgi:hypothetical protein